MTSNHVPLKPGHPGQRIRSLIQWVMSIAMVLSAVALFVVPRSDAERPLAMVRTTVTAFTEDFSTVTYRHWPATTAEWDLASGVLRVPRHPGGEAKGHPAVALDSAGNAWVVWEDLRDGERHLYAQRYSPAGARLWATDVRVSTATGTASYADVVDLGANGALVVWESAMSDIYAQRINPDGTLAWASPLDVSPSVNPQSRPAVAANASGEAVIVWREKISGKWTIYAQRLSPDKTRIWANAVKVSRYETLLDQVDPDVAMDGSGNAVVAWVDERTASRIGVYAQRLSPTGTYLWTQDAAVAVPESGSPREVQICAESGGAAYIAWLQGPLSARRVYVQRVSAGGANQWGSPLALSVDENGSASSLGLALGGGNVPVAVWVQGSLARAQRFGSAGNVFWTAGGVQIRQANAADVAVDSSGIAFVALAGDETIGSSVYAQRIGTGGALLWPITGRVCAEWYPAYQERQDLAKAPGGTVVVTWVDTRRGFWDVYAQRFDSNGARQWPSDVLITTLTGSPVRPAIAVDSGGNSIIVWGNLGGDGQDRVYARRLLADGTFDPLWTGDVEIRQVPAALRLNTLAVGIDGGGNGVIAWIEKDPLNPDVSALYAHRLDISGTLTWAGPVPVPDDVAKPDFNVDVAVAPDGRSLVVWEDRRDEPYLAVERDIFCQVLTAEGTRVWSSDLQVNTNVEGADAAEPSVALLDSNRAAIAWENYLAGQRHIYAQMVNISGKSRVWSSDVVVSSGTDFDHSVPDVTTDDAGNIRVVWYDWAYVTGQGFRSYPKGQALNASGGLLWPGGRTLSVGGTPASSLRTARDVVLWTDKRSSTADVYGQRIASGGATVWASDKRLVDPDPTYLPSAVAESLTVDTVPANILYARLTPTVTLNGGVVTYYLSNNGGVTWETVTPGTDHFFASTGSDLRWRIVLVTNSTQTASPVVDQLRIEYSTAMPTLTPTVTRTRTATPTPTIGPSPSPTSTPEESFVYMPVMLKKSVR